MGTAGWEAGLQRSVPFSVGEVILLESKAAAPKQKKASQLEGWKGFQGALIQETAAMVPARVRPVQGREWCHPLELLVPMVTFSLVWSGSCELHVATEHFECGRDS